MKILGLCIDATTPGAPFGHDMSLVALSFAIAAFASFCSLDMAERLRESEGRARLLWLVMSGLTLGSGIWSMHFVAMIALDTHMDHGYAPGLTILSGLTPVVASIGGLLVLGTAPGIRRLFAAGGVVAAGVVCMHYMGMAALQVPGTIVYRPGLFSASLLIALTASTVALWLGIAVRKTWHRVLAALLMAVAICGMHYTAMAGTVLIISPIEMASGLAHPVLVLPKGLLAALVTVGLAGLIIAGLVMAFLDRRIADQAVRETARLRDLNTVLAEARNDAEAATKAKTRFLATMSHEIRTPMNGVLGMLAVALRAELSPDVRGQLETAHDSAASLLRILNDILDFSRIEAGQMTFESLSFSPRRQVADVVSVLGPLVEQKGLYLTSHIADGTPDWIVGDPTRFRQLLTNLVGNAVKFTVTGGVSIMVAYGGDGERPHIRVEVCDTGIGIDEETRSRLFFRFSQADASTTRRFGGTGLGLAICREFVVAMKGDIGVESIPGKGSTFWFELPTRPGTASPQEAMNEASSVDLTGLRILVAEDNPVNQRVLRVLLSPGGCLLTFVSDGEAAVSAVTSQPFDIVLMDIHMPVMDGLAATAAIRAMQGDIAAIPIVALTANAMSGDRESYFAAGMTDYVSKPILIAELLGAIGRQCPRTQIAGVSASMPVPADADAPAAASADAATLASVAADLDGLLDSLHLNLQKTEAA